MINKLLGLLVILTALCATHARLDAKDITYLTGDSTATSLSKDYTILEVRKAIALCRKGEFEKAVPILQEYALKSDVGATYVLGKLYSSGLGVAANTETAARLFSANAESGHTPSMMALAALKETSSPAEALFLMKQAAEAGDLAATTQLGTIYENGKLGVVKNPRKRKR